MTAIKIKSERAVYEDSGHKLMRVSYDNGRTEMRWDLYNEDGTFAQSVFKDHPGDIKSLDTQLGMLATADNLVKECRMKLRMELQAIIEGV